SHAISQRQLLDRHRHLHFQSITSASFQFQHVNLPNHFERNPIMKSKLTLVLLCAGLWSGCLRAHAQSFSIDWFTIDGGGGTSTGGVFAVSGTVGQPDAGVAMSGGNFSVTGGFWSLFSTVQTPGAPTLSIFLTATNTAM